MKKLLSVAAALGLLVTSVSAEANDWRSGLYIKGSAGWNITRDQDYNNAGSAETELDDGYALSGAVGYKYHNGLRAELEIAYRNNDVDSHKSNGATLAGPGGEVDSVAFMANGYYDIENDTAITPYVGAGIGFAVVDVDGYNNAGTSIVSDDDTVFAYQGIAGVDFEVQDNVALFTEYKYFATSDVDVQAAGGSTDMNYDNHSIMAGVKFDLN